MGMLRTMGVGSHRKSNAVCTDHDALRDAPYQSVGAESCHISRFHHGGQQDTVLHPVLTQWSRDYPTAVDFPQSAPDGYMGIDSCAGYRAVGIPELEMAECSHQRIVEQPQRMIRWYSVN